MKKIIYFMLVILLLTVGLQPLYWSWNENFNIDKALVKSIKNEKKSSYRVIVNVDNKNALSELSSDIIVSHVNGDIYELNIPYNSGLAKKYFKNLDSWILTSKIGKLNVIKPIKLSIVWNWSLVYLDWEHTPSLWGITRMWANLYQEGLSSQSKLKVWIIDTWIDYNHYDLADNIYSNPWEIEWNGIDDDGNGLVDDIHGYDFVNNDGDPMDDHYHGTHVAGTVWAVVNGWGIFWVNSNVDLVWLKVLWADGSGSSYDIWNAIRYAADNWVKVVNLSLGGRWNPSSSYICSSIDYALSKWTITVVAAWNNNADTSKYVPAWCRNAITVSAVDKNLTRAYFSNYWDEVDVAAAWMNIFSAYPWNYYSYLNGTSMASPHIAWLVSAMLTYNWELSLTDIKWMFKNWNLTEDVLSEKQKLIGRFANMEKIMTYMWIVDDDWKNVVEPPVDDNWGNIEEPPVDEGWDSENIAPVINKLILKKAWLKYYVTVDASDSDGRVVLYKYEVYTWGIFDNTTEFTESKIKVFIPRWYTQQVKVVVTVFDNDWAIDIDEIVIYNP